ncbi:MAG: ATP-binding protein [Pseudomonadota bacterium]
MPNGTASPRKAYTLGLALIVVLVTLQFAGSRFVTNQQAVSAIEINLAGRQRMLSQRIGWTLYRISLLQGAENAEARDYERRLLAECVHLMERSHRALTARQLPLMQDVLAAGTPCLRPDELTPLTIPADRTALEDSSILAEFTQAAWSVAVGELEGAAVVDVARRLEQPLVTLLDQLDQATFEAQEASTERIELLLSFNWGLILALIAGEVFLIFRPMAKLVEGSIEDLETSNERLTESEGRLRDFAATAAHQLWETGPDFRFSYLAAANPHTRLVKASENLGKCIWELDGVEEEADDGADWDALRATMKDFKPIQSFEYSRMEAGGRLSWWRISAQPVFSLNGAFTGYRGTSLEITNERETEERLRLSERMMAVGQLTAGIAHDFNNILAVIQGNAELLPLEGKREAQAKSVEDIVAAVRRGADLTSRLLSFGRVQRLSPETIDVGDFLSRLFSLLERTLGEDFRVHVELPKSPVRVLADPFQLEDAALNLALNARDAAGSGGNLWIKTSVQRVALPMGMAGADIRAAEFATISFEDDGPGIPGEIQERIFEPFFTTKSTGEGSGLGLSMVYGFAHQSGGFLEVDSTTGAGTRIDLHLPRSRMTPTSPVQSGGEDLEVIGSGMTALLVEDNPALRDVAKRQLELLGFSVQAVGDGAAAMVAVNDNRRFDLFLLDIVLPGDIDGVDVAKVALSKHPDASILFCTGFAGTRNSRTRQDALPGPTLSKPFSIDQISKEIRKVLTHKRSTNGETC